jgi:hypothetical protein
MIINPTQMQGDDERRSAEAMSQSARKPPAEVPGYELEELLGEGAFGEVWLALDGNTGIRVAIKFYTHHDRRETSTLAAEVQKMAFLFGDRHVVQLIDVGWESDPPYFVMEYLPHGSLEKRLGDGPLPAEEAVALARDVAVALVHAHGKGIFHCDLKPANVLLDLDGRPRLADFGQSRLTHEQAPALGTLFYMAPEQADLAAIPDARWDVYALGALLYHTLTGLPPLGDVPESAVLRRSASLEHRLACYRQLVQVAPRPEAHRKVSGVDRALAEIVDRCLAPEPSRRYPNPQAVVEALDARTLWHARRPLMALAAMGPALVMVMVLAFVAEQGFDSVVAKSTHSLTEATRVSTQTVARVAADRVAGAVAQRWLDLRRVAADPEFQKRVAAAHGKRLGDPEQVALQDTLRAFHGRYKELPTHSWSVFDKDGIQVATSTFDPSNMTTYLRSLGMNFAFRDYFHGQGEDLEPGTPTEPLRAAHRSIIFRGSASGTRLVALSVPIWDGEPAEPSHPRLGVLVMQVKVGAFADFLPQRALEDSLVAALVDTKPDWKEKANVILGHPYMAQWLRDPGKSPQRVPEHALPGPPEPWDEDYQDPFGQDDPQAFGGHWFAASVPVRVEMPDATGQSVSSHDLGWTVVVQQDRNAVIEPINSLQQYLMKWRQVGLGWVVLMLTGLCGFLVYALNNSSRSRLTAFLRRRAGLMTPSGAGSLDRRSPRKSGDERTQAAAGRETVRGQAQPATRSLAPEATAPCSGAPIASADAAPATTAPTDVASAAAASSDWAWRAGPTPLETEIVTGLTEDDPAPAAEDEWGT